MSDSIDVYKLAFEALPGNSALVKTDAPLYSIVAVTTGFLEMVGKRREELINKGVLTSFTKYPNQKNLVIHLNLLQAFEYALKQKDPQKVSLPQSSFSTATGNSEEKFYITEITPIIDEQREMKFLLISVTETTEKVKATEKRENLKLAEQTYQLFMQAPVAICILKGDDKVIALANGKVLEIWRKDESVIGKPLLEGLPEIAETAFPKLLDNVIKTGEAYYANESSAYFVRNGKEELVYFNFVYQPFYEEEGGKAVGVLVIANEVTEQVVSRQKAQESEQRYRTLIAEASVATAVYEGPDMLIQYANDAMIKLWGKDATVIGKTIREALPELEGQPFHHLLQNVYNTGETYWGKEDKGEIVVDGKLQTFYFNFTYKALTNAEGKIYGILNMAIDVTEQVMASKKIEEAEERLRLALDASEQGSFEVDLLTNKMVASPRMLEIFDVETSADRERFIKAIYPEDMQVRTEAYERAYINGILEYDGRVKWKNGSVHWIRVKGKVYFSEDKKPIRIIGVVQDITEQKEFSETLSKKVEERTRDLEQSNRNLAAINKELEQFTYAASHDMQEPLRKVQTFSSILSQKYSSQLDEKARSYVSKIGSSVDRMKTIIFDLLNYSYQLNDHDNFQLTDLNKIIDDIETDLELKISQCQAHVIKSKLPLITAIPGQMNQLFYNLFSNALKFSKPGVPVIITINCAAASNYELETHGLNNEKEFIKITFSDNGIGFEQQFANYIFSLFKRLHNKDEYEGTGIGLGLCKKIVESHKGVIWATSQPGEGAVFHLLLPVLDRP